MPRFNTLIAAFDGNLRKDRQIVFIDGEDQQRALSFARLRGRALSVLGDLQRRGLRAGDAMILFLPDNERFLEMFWACVFGGLVPVPIAVGNGDEHRRKLFRVFERFDRAFVYSELKTMERMDVFASAQGLSDAHARLRQQVLLAGTLDAAGAAGTPAVRSPDDIAFVQYSSGSTSEPKGVVLTHRNITANIASISEAARFTDRDVALSWMPLTHDMGLIGFHLHMLAAGVTHAIMRTDVFVRRPLLWLAKATELKATILCSPNFGYEHYLKRHESKRPPGLDLEPVRLIFNGAEPISADVCRRFTSAMAAHGLSSNAMFPVYGLAEASLAVTFPKPGAPLQTLFLDRGALNVGTTVRTVPNGTVRAAEFVKVGRPVPGVEVRIADEAGAALCDGVLGRVLMRGDNVTRGYYRDDEATAKVRSLDGWLDTGDLGFLGDGELVIAGRAKDILFVNGQNWYPHDLESLALQVEGIETNKVVAAGVRNARTGSEDLALFVLHRGPVAALVDTASALRTTIGGQTGLGVAHVVPVARVPKTTSGKLRRYALARAFEEGEFDAEAREMSRLLYLALSSEADSGPSADGETAQRLKQITERIIPDKQVSVQTNLFEINLNSLLLARIHEAIDVEFPDRLEVTDLFDHPTLDELARYLDGQRQGR